MEEKPLNCESYSEQEEKTAENAVFYNEAAAIPIKRKRPLLTTAALFVGGLLLLIFICSPLQLTYGMYGVLATEILILAYAVITALVLKFGLKNTFPVKLPTFRKLAASLLTWIGCYAVVMLVALFLFYFFPQSSTQTSEGIEYLLDGIPKTAIFLIMSVAPAICEEALFRGTILTSLKRLKSPVWAVVLCGVMFGIYHLSFVKFFTTAILGVTLAYVMIKTENIIYPMLIHFINNAVSVLPILMLSFSPTAGNVSEIITVGMLGIYLVLFSAAPLVLLKGVLMCDDKVDKRNFEEYRAYKKRNSKKWLAAFIAFVVLAVLGVILAISDPQLGELINSGTAAFCLKMK